MSPDDEVPRALQLGTYPGPMSTAAGSTWAKNLTYSAQELIEPTSEEQLSEVMASAEHIRLLGSRHSFNRIADTTGTMINLGALPVEVDIDSDAQVVRTSAGITFGALGVHLQQQGWALHAMASLPHITVAGAVSTDTHGSGDEAPSLAQGVAALEVVTSRGDRVRLQRGAEDFESAVVSLGMLGAITTVELDIEPSYDVAQTVYDGLTWETVVADLDTVTTLGTSVSIFTDWQDRDRTTQVWVKQRTDRVGGDPAALGLTPAREARHPHKGNPAHNCTEQLGIPGPWVDRLPHFRVDFTPSNGAEVQSEWLVPRAQVGSVIEVLRGLSGEIAPLLHGCEVRTVAAGGQTLGLTQGTACVAFHFTWRPDQGAVEALLPRIEAGLNPLGARPHWAKLFDESRFADRVADLYPRLDAMLALRRRMDPRGALRNDFLDRLGL